MRQLITMQVKNADNPKQRLEAMARFGSFFGGTLFDIYGGIFAKSNDFNPDTLPRKKRTLRLDAPEVHFFNTSDGVQLRLTRYKGGSKGPVILSPGFGTSSLAYAIDTVETNPTEYLYAHGYDVWLFDYRASPELPSASSQFTIDDIATKDYPAAISKVRELTGAESVQVVAHCIGSMSFIMAMLAGLQGVRSAVCSQLATHPVSPALNEIKSALYLPTLLKELGDKTLTTDFKARDWKDRLFDEILRLYPTQPGERCNNPVCRRIRFMYGEVYKHDQLNNATHNSIHEVFGVANLSAFEHIALMLRQPNQPKWWQFWKFLKYRGHIVDKDGNDAYLPHLERLAIPIAFIHGAENGLFFPKGTEITYNLLCEKNGSHLYSRHVISNYAHMDCFIGKNAARDVYPIILAELEKANV
jgi:cholesterol oxidase